MRHAAKPSSGEAGRSWRVESASAREHAALMEAVELLLVRAQEAGAVRCDIGMPELFGLVAGTCMLAERQYPNVCSAERMLSIVFDALRPAAGSGPG